MTGEIAGYEHGRPTIASMQAYGQEDQEMIRPVLSFYLLTAAGQDPEGHEGPQI